MFAVVRPGSWNLSLFFHVAGAMVLVASLVVALYAIRIARRRGDQPAAQFAFRVLLRVSVPAFLVMRVFAQIIDNKEHADKLNPAWINVGFSVSDGSPLFLIAGLVLTGLMARRAKQGTSVAGSTQLRVAGVLASVMLVGYIVAIWAMTTKPT
jgi:hypothetical protein